MLFFILNYYEEVFIIRFDCLVIMLMRFKRPEERNYGRNGLPRVSNYCHSEYDWSMADDNPSIMSLEMGEETDSTYQVVFRSYTGAWVYFHVDKTSGSTRMVERVPMLGIENEAGTIELFDYLEK